MLRTGLSLLFLLALMSSYGCGSVKERYIVQKIIPRAQPEEMRDDISVPAPVCDNKTNGDLLSCKNAWKRYACVTVFRMSNVMFRLTQDNDSYEIPEACYKILNMEENK